MPLILATQEMKIEGITAGAKSYQDPISTNKPSIVPCAVIPATLEAIGRNIAV
jgi:hypothetical protein